MLFLRMTFFFLLASCSLFKGVSSLENKDKEKLLDSVKLTGEGKGRLTLGEAHYVFGVDSVLKDNQDWILAVSIPLHGEEVMILPDLKKKEIEDEETESFEARIQNEFKRLKLNRVITGKRFLTELRSLIRFNLSHEWGQKRNCSSEQSEFVCELDGEKFYIDVHKNELTITKLLGEGKSLQLLARNLTGPFFAQNEIRLYTSESEKAKKSSPISLEMFW